MPGGRGVCSWTLLAINLSLAWLAPGAQSLSAAAAPGPLVPGRFGQALDASQAQPVAAGRDAYVHPPLTVECWAWLRSRDNFNLLVASEPKASGRHWELYSFAGSGVFSVYLPGCVPAEIKSAVDITDRRWHYLAALLETNRVRLYVDARLVADQAVTRRHEPPCQPGALTFGTAAAPYELKCDGWMDDVRLSQGLRAIRSVPTRPLEPDAQTVGLWAFDRMTARGEMPDGSRTGNPAIVKPVERIAMDELDRRGFQPGPSPLDAKARGISLDSGALSHPQGPPVICLDGVWEMAEGGAAEDRLHRSWTDAIPARVPGSVHAALAAAGRIPDPKHGRNDAIAHDQSFKTWWFKRVFSRLAGGAGERLVFDGVAIRCAVWLNGEPLGTHDGMFGGPAFDVASRLCDRNTLVVKLDPAPGDPKAWNNPAWKTTVVFNNVWGWHYSSIPALGLWRSVRLEAAPTVRIARPFVATHDARQGAIDLVADLQGPEPGWAGRLSGTIVPDTFAGPPCHFAERVRAGQATRRVHYRFRVPSPRLWWPNGLGDPHLYRLTLSFEPGPAGVADTTQTTFGIRTLEMRPLPGGPRADRYNWTFVVNGRPVFVKGTGWCTMDSSMDFSRARYNRFLTLARLQHVQMLRAWGSGAPETDDFYDLCDRKGILVLQEWPTAWDSHQVQPFDVLEETVRLNTLRLRNHPSLAMYGAGNESGHPFGRAIDMMGRYAVELDGTRPFHRAEPWGGSQHNYNCYWGRQPLDHNLTMTAAFWGEFGLASMPVLESVLRYLPDPEKHLWPPPPGGSLIHHTPIFGTADDWARLSQYAAGFVDPTNLPTLILGSQLAQAVGVRHTLERARTRWPDCTGALYYKMNDNYPAASWACADWYGAPKIGHYLFQDAFAPLHACVLFTRIHNRAKAVSWPVFLLDDADALRAGEWTTGVRAFDAKLQPVHAAHYSGRGSIAAPRHLGDFTLTGRQTDTAPLFVVAEVTRNGVRADRTFYFVNYEEPKGCLFTLPRTTLSLRFQDGHAHIANIGSLPAVGVAVSQPGHLDTFTADDNCFWLDPGESHAVRVNAPDGLQAGAWNADAVQSR